MASDPLRTISNGVNELSINDVSVSKPQSQKKKRQARAYHNLQQVQDPIDPPTNGYSQYQNSATSTPASQYPSQFSNQFSGTPIQSAGNTPQTQFNSQFHYDSQQQQYPIQGQILDNSKQYTENKVHLKTIGLTDAPTSNTLSVPYIRQLAQEEWRLESFKSFQDSVPPTATTTYNALDQGCSIPKFATLSMYQVPESETLRNLTKLPLALTIRPFASPGSDEEQIPDVFMDPFDGPLRCRRCRAYVNPQMKFTHDQRFICNICKFPNTVPHEYAAPLDAQGRRVDFLQRAELHKGTVDFVVPESYWLEQNKKPDPLHQIFLIDVSASNEILESTAQALREVVDGLNGQTKISIVTFDQRLHFYDLESETLNIHTVSDLDDPFIPIDSGLFVDPRENSGQINSALSRITELYSSFKSISVAYGSALEASLMALQKYGGGKITAFLSNIPSWGPGSLVSTNDKSRGLEDFKTSNAFYSKLSDTFVSQNVGLDLFVISRSSVDLINTAAPVFATGGTLKLYSNFSVQKDELQFTQDLYQSVTNTTGYQGQLKVRCSNGLQIESYYGNILNPSSRDPVLPILSSDQEFTALFKYDSKLDRKDDVHFQTALLYTGIDGSRRVRVINTIAAVTSDVSSVFAFADQDVVLNSIIKNCLKFIGKQDTIDIKNTTTTKLTEIFSHFKQQVANSHSRQAQLILPESLTTLTAFVSSFQKSKIFKTSTSNNLKIYDYYRLNTLPLAKLLLYLYPEIIPLHELGENDGLIDPSTGFFKIPNMVRASSQFVKEGGAYLVFNGEQLVLWIHSRVNPLLLEDLFGVGSVQDLNPDLTEFPPLSTKISEQARGIIEHYQNLLKRYIVPFRLLRQGLDGIEFQFGEFLVEDRAVDKTESYAELISVIHKRIRESLEKEEHSHANNVRHEDSTLTQRFVHF